MEETTEPKKVRRPEETEGPSIRKTTGCGNLYIRCGFDPGSGRLIEIFATLGKAGGCATCQLEAITRSVTLGLKYGVPVQEYIDELKDIKCPRSNWSEGVFIKSCSDAIAQVLKEVTGGSTE